MKFTEFTSAKGATIEELEAYLDTRGEAQYADVPISSLVFTDDGKVQLNGTGTPLPITSVGVRGISRRLKGAPFYYLERAPTDIAVQNLNYFLPSADGNIRMVLEKDVVVGAVPANYEPVRHGLLVEALARIKEGFDLHGWRCGNEGLFLRFTSPEFVIEPKKGDELRAGVDVSNPDCDRGKGLDVTGNIFRLICSNGAVIPEVTFRRRLSGSGWRKPEELALHAVGYFEDACRETIQQSGAVSGLVDIPIRTFDPTDERECKRELKPATNLIRCPGGLRVSLAEALRTEDETMFGFYNAVTRLGRDAAEPKLQHTLERCGFRVVERQAQLAEILAP